MKNKPLLIGIAGGTGSGKTTVAKKIIHHFGKDAVYIPHDNYYRDQTALDMETRKAVNYDHPDSLETSLLVKHLISLKNGKSIGMPQYDFAQCNRLADVENVKPAAIMVIEGILVFQDETLRSMFDMKIYVDTEADIRLGRRINRDIVERGRTLEFSLQQYLALSRPMHTTFVEPSKKYADIILPEGGNNKIGVTAIINSIEMLKKH